MYLIYVGVDPANEGGLSSKGYWIRRRGSEVRVTYGPIDTEGARGGRHYWRAGVTERRPRAFASEPDAAEYVRRKIRDKKAEGYESLRTGRNIKQRTFDSR